MGLKWGSVAAAATVAAAFLSTAGAQPAGTVRRIEPLPAPNVFQRIGIEQGLPQQHVIDIAQDPEGFLWFATQEGLARYDGGSMKVYRAAATPGGLGSSYITAIELAPDGALWLGTLDAGACRMDRAKETFACLRAADKKLSTDGVTALHVEGDVVWIGTADGAVHRVVQGGAATETFELAEEGREAAAISSFASAGGGKLWVGSRGDGLRRFDAKSGAIETFIHADDEAGSLASNTVNALLADGKGGVWVGTEGGLDHLPDASGKKFTHYAPRPEDPRSLSNASVLALMLDRDGVLWAGTNTDLNQLNADGSFTRYAADLDKPTSLSYQTVTAAFQDKGGVRWFGTSSGGLSKLDDTRRAFNFQTGATASGVCFVEDGADRLWVGSSPGALSRFDFKKGTVTLYTKLGTAEGESIDLARWWVTAIERSADGTLWLATEGGGLIAFDPKTELAAQYTTENADNVESDTIWRLARDRAGILWAATWGGGLLRIDPVARTFRSYLEGDGGLTTGSLYTVVEDKQAAGVLWIGGAQAGLFRMDSAKGSFQAYGSKADDPSTLSSPDVTSIQQGADGALWVGTYGGGLNRFDPKSGKAERLGGPAGTIYGILGGADGSLWMSTNGGGLVAYDPAKKAFRPYDSRDGVLNEYAQPAYYADSAGRLHFGGPGGFVRFDPKSIPVDTFVPPVVITSFKIFDQEAALGDAVWKRPPVHLGFRDSVISFEFAALSFATPEKVRYAYMLEGLEDDWVETDRRFVTYSNIGGGDYTFRVRAMNRDGVWNEAGAALAMEIDNPPWKRWWAYLIYAAILGAIGFAIWRYQQQKIKTAERDGKLAAAERDLALTGAVQAGFLPQVSQVATPSISLVGLYKPAQECSGDWWWHEQRPTSRCILVGDVTGHGPGPAMVTAAAATAFRVQPDDVDFGRRMDVINAEVMRVGGGKYQMTMSALDLDERTGKYTFYSAGGLPLMIIDANGKVKIVPCRGTPLGTSEFRMGSIEGALKHNERALLYTDGIPEIMLENGKQLGMRKMSKMVEETRTYELPQAAERLLTEANKLQRGLPQDDDWTLAMVQWNATA